MPKAANENTRDRELLHTIGQFIELQRRATDLYRPEADALFASDDARDDALSAIIELQRPLVHGMCAMRATTKAGFVGRARALVVYAPELASEGDADDYTSAMLAALLRDMTASLAA